MLLRSLLLKDFEKKRPSRVPEARAEFNKSLSTERSDLDFLLKLCEHVTL